MTENGDGVTTSNNGTQFTNEWNTRKEGSLVSGVRVADIPDMDALCDLGEELLNHSVYANIKPDEEKFRRFVAGMMGIKTGTVLVVVDDNDKPQGFLLGVVDELFFSTRRQATDLAVYVREGYRHLAPRLFRTFIKWAESKPRVERVTLGISSGIGDPERVGKMYGKLGLSQVGGIFVKSIERV